MSDHACRIITHFLTNTLARAPENDETSEGEDEAGTRDSDCIKPLCPSLETLHKILREQSGVEGEGAGTSRARRKHERTIQRTRTMWAAAGTDVGMPDTVDTGGDKPTLRVAEYSKLARALGKQQDSDAAMPFAGNTEPMASIYEQQTEITVAEWLRDLRRDELEITLQLQDDEHELDCLDTVHAGGRTACVIRSVDAGFVQRWNAT